MNANTTMCADLECSALNLTEPHERMSSDDSAWILGNAFLIMTMQSGFGLLEAGSVSPKNIANIMVKNIVDVTLGGITYWAFGYGLSFGEPSNWFCGFGDWFFTVTDVRIMGTMYTKYLFQFSFATAATTIVSGAIAERMKLSAYSIFSILNIFVYCLPVAWTWNEAGFLAQLGFFDFAGAVVVHMTGGVSAVAAAAILRPRVGRFTEKDHYTMSSPVTVLTGTFMLWWAWLGFNCGSTFGIDGEQWKIAAKVGVNTMNGSFGGSIAALVLSLIVSKGKVYDIAYLVNGILAGLVAVTACCAVISPAESILCGAIGAVLSVGATRLLTIVKIDDPVGAVPVHMVAGMWSGIAVGLFGQNDFDLLSGRNGLFHGGGWHLLGVQVAGLSVMAIWSFGLTCIIFLGIKLTIGIRMSMDDEIMGADWVEHKVRQPTPADHLQQALLNANDNDQQMALLLKRLMEQMNEVTDGSRTKANRGTNPISFGGNLPGLRGIPAQHNPEPAAGPAYFNNNQNRKMEMKQGEAEEQKKNKEVNVGSRLSSEKPKLAWSEEGIAPTGHICD